MKKLAGTKLTCGLIHTMFFLRDNVRGVGGNSRSSCRPFELRENMPFSWRPPLAREPFECTASADLGRERVDR